MKFYDKVKQLGACKEGLDWLGDKTEKEFWDTCQKGKWLLWYLKSTIKKPTLATHRKLVHITCDIAESVLKYVPADEKRPAEAIRLARAWANGEKISKEEICGSRTSSMNQSIT